MLKIILNENNGDIIIQIEGTITEKQLIILKHYINNLKIDKKEGAE